jgi:hypothetical protein
MLTLGAGGVILGPTRFNLRAGLPGASTAAVVVSSGTLAAARAARSANGPNATNPGVKRPLKRGESGRAASLCLPLGNRFRSRATPTLRPPVRSPYIQIKSLGRRPGRAQSSGLTFFGGFATGKVVLAT